MGGVNTASETMVEGRNQIMSMGTSSDTPSGDEAELKYVPLRPLIECQKMLNSVKGQDKRPVGRP